jgi:D-erythro-7,8-dihydroneopterin triphosphate epimerase
MIIRIKNLRLRCIIGINDWERENKQDVIINLKIEFDGEAAAASDDISHTVNYRTITKQIIELVEGSDFGLIEKLCSRILDVCMADPKVKKAKVEIDKPGALRFSDSVSMSDSRKRS